MTYPLLRHITLATYFGLLAVLLYWVASFGPDDIAAMLTLWVLVISGLLLVAPGLVKGTKRSYIWLCFILLMYFLFFVVALFSGTVAAHEVLAMILVVTAFIASMLASRQAPG